MLRTPSACLRTLSYLLSLAVLLGCAATVAADPKPLPKPEQEKVDRAVEKGVAYLKRMQAKDGHWAAKPYENSYFVGQCALCAYALLEAGVPPDDPVIRKATEYLRPRALKTARIYEISLAILFLDRLGEPKDKKLIQSLALRVIAGQHRTGGWSYYCQIVKEGQEETLLNLLAELSKGIETGKPYAEVLDKLDVPSQLRRLTVFQDPQKLDWREQMSPPGAKAASIPLVGATDNSNTQFAMLALWAAQRHGVPIGPTFRLMVERFERYQTESGRWSYICTTRPDAGMWRSVTCAGLLALAIGRGAKLPTSGSSLKGGEDVRVLRGLNALYQGIEYHTGSMENLLPFEDVYFLWSLERVGMLYNLPTLGDKEWYRWGAEILVTNQNRSGSWPGVTQRPEGVEAPLNYGPVLSTAFALLFFKHSHPMKDLTPKLPFTPKELNSGIARLHPSEKRQEPKEDTSRGSRKPER